ncbi:MAG: hypothetical protein HFJ59_00880 [Clostridia bacterium]|nr:hypothetical protein [Clostridia bacterium]
MDELGTVVLPLEQRDYLTVVEKDVMEISLDFLGNFVIKPQKNVLVVVELKTLEK